MTDYPPILLLLGPVAALVAALAFLALWGLVTFPFAVLVGRMLRDQAAEDAVTAADFGEPTREQIEAGWLFDDPAFIDTPIYAEMRREEDAWFAASVLADIDELPGGDAA